MLAQTSVVVSHRLTGRAASSSDSAKSPPFHSAGRSRACGMTPGSQSSVAMLSFHMGFIQREDMRARHGVPGIVPLRAGRIKRSYFSELAWAVSVFQLEKFDFCFPSFLTLFAARGCEFTEADGSTFSETQFCRPGEHTAAFSRHGNSELREHCESLAGLICSSNQLLFLDMDSAKVLWYNLLMG